MYKTINSFSGEYKFLSNFYQKPFVYKGIIMNTAEHAYQASKCLDITECCEILFSSSPYAAKSLGQKCKIREDWDKVKVDEMHKILLAKFSDVELREKLLKTEDFELIEGNTWGDTFWGVCNGEGKNWLGRLLMKVRGEYMSQKCILESPR